MEALCKLVYAEVGTKYGHGTELVRCVPNDGVCLYEICATYAKQVPYSTYFYLGRNEKDAKTRFLSVMSWMTVVKIRLISSETEKEDILTDKFKMPMR